MHQESRTPRKPLTIRAFSRETGYSPRQVKKAIKLGEIRVVVFAGKELIPPSEADRVREFAA